MAPVCDQEGCPIQSEGRCLEGFPTGEGCPHLHEGEEPAAASEEDSAEESFANEDAVPEVEEMVHLAGDAALTPAEAHDVASEHGARLVLVAGEFEAGKTTLGVELYGRFLLGAYEGWKFGGSHTLIALDKRYFPTRYASGREKAVTERTQTGHEGLLHFRLASDGREFALLLSDYRGERFENIIDGASVQEETPIARRADATLVLINGVKIADSKLRQESIVRTRLLIGGLTDGGGVTRGRPMAIVLTKADLIDEATAQWFNTRASELSSFATERGAIPTLFHVAARPDDSPDDPVNLEQLFNWMVNPPVNAVEAPAYTPEPAHRLYWQFTLR